jgi:RNA recognition motif-containing protein
VRRGQPRGFAFLEMSDSQAAATAIKELNLREMVGRAITMREARPKTDLPRLGGGLDRGDKRSSRNLRAEVRDRIPIVASRARLGSRRFGRVPPRFFSKQERKYCGN